MTGASSAPPGGGADGQMWVLQDRHALDCGDRADDAVREVEAARVDVSGGTTR